MFMLEVLNLVRVESSKDSNQPPYRLPILRPRVDYASTTNVYSRGSMIYWHSSIARLLTSIGGWVREL